jgi:outer membrane immunogenic protein
MKRSVLAGVLLLSAHVGFGPALAADVIAYPTVPVPEVPAIVDWTGHYIGLQGGYAFGTGDYRNTEVDDRHMTGDINGWFGGVRAGADWQNGQTVWGLFGEGELGNIHGDLTDDNFGFSQFSTRWFATFGGRLGVAQGNTLFYALAGLALAGFEHDWSANFPGEFPLPDKTAAGWSAGLGLEHQFGNGWSGYIEGRYYDFGRVSVPAQEFVVAHDIEARFGALKLGVNYRW